MSVQRLELWIDRATNLPVKIRSRDKNKNDTTVTFEKIRTNQDVEANVFHVPRRLGWEVVRRPLKGAKNIRP
jgi:outer membrane lipoprotein-sorting protein